LGFEASVIINGSPMNAGLVAGCWTCIKLPCFTSILFRTARLGRATGI